MSTPMRVEIDADDLALLARVAKTIMNNGEQQARMWPWIRLTEQQAATCGLMANSGDHRTDDLRASRRARINNAIDRADELIAAVRTVRAIERMPT